MAIELGAAYISILPETSKLASGIRKELGLAERAASGAGTRSGSAFGKTFTAGLARWTKRGLLAGAAGVGILGAGALKMASDLEQAQIGFTTMLGSGEKAAAFIAQIKKTAAETPFEVKGLTASAQQLLAYGFAAKDVIPTLTTLGDAASGLGLGTDGLQRISLALGQIKSKGRVQGQEVLQLTEAGIPAQKILRNQLNLTATAYDKLQRTGKITADKAIPLLLKGMKKGTKGIAGETTKFGGLMEKQSHSMQGLFSTLHDTVFLGLADAIKPLEPAIKNGLQKAIDNTGPGLKRASKASAQLIDEWQKGVGTGGALRDTLGDISDVVKGVAKGTAAATKAFRSMPESAQKVALLAGALFLLKRRYGESIPSLQNFDKAAFTSKAKTLALRGAAVGAGIALAGLADNAGGAKTNLGGLLTIGSDVATGFAVGGPIGAAIGGVTGVLQVFAAQSKAAKQEQQGLNDAGKRVADTLNQQTGALTKLSFATAAKELADSGALSAARAMGISLQDVVNASLGQKDALYKVTGASNAWADAQVRSGKYTEKQEGQLATLRKAIDANATSIGKQRSKIDLVNEAMGRAKDKTVSFNVKTPGLGGALAGLATLGLQIDKAIAKSAKLKKPGENAKGTNNWRGGLTWVGEEGPELLNIQKGAQIIPNNKIGDVGRDIAATSAVAVKATAPAPSMPKRMTLQVGGRQFDAYMSDIAGDVVNAEAGFAGTIRRMNS